MVCQEIIENVQKITNVESFCKNFCNCIINEPIKVKLSLLQIFTNGLIYEISAEERGDFVVQKYILPMFCKLEEECFEEAKELLRENMVGLKDIFDFYLEKWILEISSDAGQNLLSLF
eukprot:TRINITY_DN261_c0_g1_i2.p1 TRINITY_DN261_c0_g1~~TRINITY_DN261_c0_g1_i2.p1  ORF type:complete len:126 (-),score=41.67 TRINITY_DN261_c0_g1_i2:280-633(-)